MDEKELEGKHIGAPTEAPLTKLTAVDPMAISESAPINLAATDPILADLAFTIKLAPTNLHIGAEPSSVAVDPNEEVGN